MHIHRTNSVHLRDPRSHDDLQEQACSACALRGARVEQCTSNWQAISVGIENAKQSQELVDFNIPAGIRNTF